jgi:hypothetical protein
MRIRMADEGGSRAWLMTTLAMPQVERREALALRHWARASRKRQTLVTGLCRGRAETGPRKPLARRKSGLPDLRTQRADLG